MYYRLGATVARWFVNFCYELVCDPAGFDRQLAKAPPGAIRVYVFNHRSNFDPVVVAFGLVRQVAMSYAVGEWALVWPLSAIFRSFGSYFVRRGEPDPLYHAVLERFVQLLAGHGAVTGFFPEGGLTRDGALRRARSGLLDYLIKLRREFPERDLIFLPVGLNYDRVLEDRWLVRERDGRPPRAALVVRLANLAALIVWVPWLLAANLLRVATRSHRKFGYAAMEFGEPLLLSEWPGGATIHELDDALRKPAVDALATELLYQRIGRAIPVTPVAASCVALLRPGALDDSAVVARIRDMLREARKGGARIALGRAFDDVKQRRAAPDDLDSRMGGTDAQLLDLEEAERIWALSRSQLSRRGVVWRRQGVITVREPEVVEYYALSIVHHLDADWPAARDARKEAGEAGRPEVPWGVRDAAAPTRRP